MKTLNHKQSQLIHGGVVDTVMTLALIVLPNGDTAPEEVQANPLPEGPSKGGTSPTKKAGGHGATARSGNLIVPLGSF